MEVGEPGEGVHPTPPSHPRDGVEEVELGPSDISHQEDTHTRGTERRKKRTRRGTKREKETGVLSERETSVVPDGENGGSTSHDERQREMTVGDQGKVCKSIVHVVDRVLCHQFVISCYRYRDSNPAVARPPL